MGTSELLSLSSIVLGLFAWILPLVATVKTRPSLSIVSFSACGLSLVLQFYEIRYRVNIRDFSALMDTMNALCWVAAVLVAVTLILNVFALWCTRKKA